MSKVVKKSRPAQCIGENIRILLAVRGMSRKEFCRRINISKSELSYWITGKIIVPTEQIFRSAEILKVTPPDLLRPAQEFGENCLRFLA